MAKKKIIETIHNCNSCIVSILSDNKLYCKNKIKDINEPFPTSAITSTKVNCSYYKPKEK